MLIQRVALVRVAWVCRNVARRNAAAGLMTIVAMSTRVRSRASPNAGLGHQARAAWCCQASSRHVGASVAIATRRLPRAALVLACWARMTLTLTK